LTPAPLLASRSWYTKQPDLQPTCSLLLKCHSPHAEFLHQTHFLGRTIDHTKRNGKWLLPQHSLNIWWMKSSRIQNSSQDPPAITRWVSTMSVRSIMIPSCI
jgi:hypothetical protein